MAAKLITRGQFVFDVWPHYMRMVGPKVSPIFSSYTDLLENEGNLNKAIDDFIAIMNLGIEIIDERPRRIILGRG